MNNSIEKTGRIYDYVAVGILIVGLALIFLIPHWFVQPARIGKFDLSETGNIGATIGGVTAPIVGFVTAIMMYIAFKVQYIANSKQWAAFNSELKIKNLQNISSEIESIIKTIEPHEVEMLKISIKEGIKNPNIRPDIMDKYLLLIRKSILYIDNFLFLFSSVHNNDFENVIKENYRLQLLRFDSHFNDNLYLIEQFLIEYEKLNLFSDAKSESIRNFHFMRLLYSKLGPYIKNVEFLTENGYVK